LSPKPSRRKKQKPPPGSPREAAAPGTTLRVRKIAGQDAWELVHPRCARDRAEDLEEVRKMLDAGETEVAIDECRWLLQGCSDCLEAHRILGEIAMQANDLPLARGHFGYAYRLAAQALERAGVSGPLPYAVPANQGFLESAKGLAWCLKQLGKRDMAAEVVALAAKCDSSDPLDIARLLDEPSIG
jgi:hypothetical protein